MMHPVLEQKKPFPTTRPDVTIKCRSVKSSTAVTRPSLSLGTAQPRQFGSAANLSEPDNFVALKVYVNSLKVHREFGFYTHINSLQLSHEGRHRIRKLHGYFEVEGPHGIRSCLVHEPLCTSLGQLKGRDDIVLPEDAIRDFIRQTIVGLQFLHQEAHVIHADLQTDHIFMGIDSPAIFEQLLRAISKDRIPQKAVADRMIHLSQYMPLSNGLPSLADFSEARSNLGMQWSYPVDIWSLGMVVWDLFEPKRLFPPWDEDGHYSKHHPLAQLTALLGPPPMDLLARSETSDEFWNHDGNWKGEVPIPDSNLEAAEKHFNGEEKRQLLTWIRKMLQWRPEDRVDCKDVIWDEWLLVDMIESGQIIR